MLAEQFWHCAARTEILLRDRGYRFCFIGGLAVNRWGEPRFTRDLDLSLFSQLGDERRLVERLLDDFRPRRSDATSFALTHRVLLVEDGEGFPIDIALAFFPFEERMLGRSSQWSLPIGAGVTTCAAEDLVVLKAFAARDQDWTDIRGILIRQGLRLDREKVLAELAPLVEMKEEPEIMERIGKLFASFTP